MELHLRREDRKTRGQLYIESAWECYTIERAADDPLHPSIKAGTYKVVMTPSERAKQGALWSPRPDFVLPLLVDVPGRDGIRIHAANKIYELIGCIAIGQDRAGDDLIHSRLALIALMSRIIEPCFITVTDPKE